MNMEQMGGFTNENLEIKNQMQMQLAERNGEDLMDFIDNRAKQFGEYLDSHAEVLNTFKTNPEQALKEMEDVIYH